ncbi:PDR/VanB family oxidoreductase [Microbacterium sp. NPDC077663]|uniref:PDR/VanB family oxidoreductase n=1 Tax=Microbacterium sp. NPDC077663 TaxID=3364189 RepID=UPI0037C6CDFF
MSAEPVNPEGPISLIVRGMRWEADGALAMRLEHPDGVELPEWEAGAHIDVTLPNGVERQYSLVSDPRERTHWAIVVLREDVSRGGSRFIHRELRPGDALVSSPPRNNFAYGPAEETIFIAGGIGMTAILPMIREAELAESRWRLLYIGRSLSRMAFLRHNLLAGPHSTILAGDRDARVDLKAWIGDVGEDHAVYACGPQRMLDELETLSVDWPAGTLHVERFQPKSFDDFGDGEAFEVEARTSGLRVTVDAGCSILDALEKAGIPVPSSCLEGVCGTCETRIIDGEAEHRDSILDPIEQQANETMMICVSRSKTPTLVLDI